MVEFIDGDHGFISSPIGYVMFNRNQMKQRDQDKDITGSMVSELPLGPKNTDLSKLLFTECLSVDDSTKAF